MNLRLLLKRLVTGQPARDQEPAAYGPVAETSSSLPQMNGGVYSALQFNERGLVKMNNGRLDEAAASFRLAIDRLSAASTIRGTRR